MARGPIGRRPSSPSKKETVSNSLKEPKNVNSKSEARNPEQIQMFKMLITQTDRICFEFGDLSFESVSDLDIRISNLRS